MQFKKKNKGKKEQNNTQAFVETKGVTLFIALGDFAKIICFMTFFPHLSIVVFFVFVKLFLFGVFFFGWYCPFILPLELLLFYVCLRGKNNA